MHVLENILAEFVSDDVKLISQEKYDGFAYDINEAHEKIQKYKSHVIRNQMANAEWEKKLEEKKPHQAFMTIDWASCPCPIYICITLKNDNCLMIFWGKNERFLKKCIFDRNDST